MELAAEADENGAREWLQVEGLEIENPAGFRRWREKERKRTVEPEAFDEVGAVASTDRVRGFENLKRYAALGETLAAGEPREPGPDDQHLRFRGHGENATVDGCEEHRPAFKLRVGGRDRAAWGTGGHDPFAVRCASTSRAARRSGTTG